MIYLLISLHCTLEGKERELERERERGGGGEAIALCNMYNSYIIMSTAILVINSMYIELPLTL